MVTDPLEIYRGMRDPERTPEPVPPAGPLPEGNDDTFVIQEHHARALHWDVRLERGGVLVSWAVPKGLPLDPKTNHLAVHTEDHPLEYASFAGDIPRGEYGGGQVYLWDRGTYELEKWSDREVKVVLHGTRVEGRYVFFHTGGKNWMVHRMDPPPDPDWEPVPVKARPMLPTPGPLPGGKSWAYELAWGGIRALVSVSGGRARIVDARGNDVSVAYPELRPLGEALGSRAVLLDGEVVALAKDGRPDPRQLRRRPAKATAPPPKTVRESPVTFLASDVLHLDGHPTTSLPWEERRVLLESLGVSAPRWSVAPRLDSGSDAVRASRDLGLTGVLAKRLASPYTAGRSEDWRLVDSRREEEVAIGGWVADGNDEPRALLVGTAGADGLVYVTTVRSGLSEDRAELTRRLHRLSRKTSPFVDEVPTRSSVRWVRPSVTGVITTTGTPSWSRFT